MSTNALDFLFPAPPLLLSRRTQVFYPGTSAASTAALQKILKDNHVKWHVFFNEKRFHNHAAHRAIAAWALGANAATLEEGYKQDCRYEKPAFKSPERITPENFNEHLGDDRFYEAYLEFFTHYVHEKGVPSALEEFIFSRKANIGTSTGANVLPVHKQPQMLSRLFTGVLHPMIHVGYGAEFHLPGMIVEGLAQTAVHKALPELLCDLSLFEEESFTAALFNKRIINEASQAIGTAFNDTITAFDKALDKVIPKALDDGLMDMVPTQPEQKPSAADEFGPSQVKGKYPTFKEDTAQYEERKPNTHHALSILEHLLIDRRLTLPPSTNPDAGPSAIHSEVTKKHGHIIAQYVNSWPIDFSRLSGSRKEAEREVASKIEEIVWVIGVLYGVGGWTDRPYSNGRFNADFLLMHLCTSSIFLPAFCDLLSPSSQMRLLKGYLMTVFTWAVARGRPKLDLEGFFSSDLSQRETEDAWGSILREGMSHHDEHVTKILRSLSLWGGLFGTRQATAGISLESTTPGTASSAPQLPERKVEGKEDTGAADAILGVYPGSPRRAAFHQESNVMPVVTMPGAEFLDGSLFLKAALLTLDRMNWDTKDSEEEREKKRSKGAEDRDEDFWDFKGFFKQGAGGGGKPIMKAKI
ncbi:hypothetical protein CVT24_004952 [Panaeolus cyanescens]|uniref:Oxidoreductase AflY n=1 Tax=Panaeolus cyanescens TaxID=181874 RepID=A0A409YB42_9AGAR|nr:hypothetical protein CVT24_004952 [Panaeolus cyanescens]